MSARTSPTRSFGIDAVALLALIRKEFIQALRDRRMLFMLLGVPVVQVILFGYAANLEFAHAATAVVDDDRSEESRAFVTGLGAEGTFALRPLRTDEDALRSLRLAESQAAIIIPRRFGEKLRAGRSAEVQLLVDGTEPTRAVGAAAALSGYAQRAGARTLVAAGVARPGMIQLQPRLLYNPGLKSRLFMVPGTAASILLIITTVVTAMGLARERELKPGTIVAFDYLSFAGLLWNHRYSNQVVYLDDTEHPLEQARKLGATWIYTRPKSKLFDQLVESRADRERLGGYEHIGGLERTGVGQIFRYLPPRAPK